MADNYDSLTVKQLKDEVANRDGLTINSKSRKAEIIEKLRKWDEEHAAESEQEDEKKAVPETPQDVREEEHAASDDDPAAPPKAGEGAAQNAPESADTPPAIETAPKEVSALSEPTQEPTPPPHHATIEPQEPEKPVQSSELDNAVQDFAMLSAPADTPSTEAKNDSTSTRDMPPASTDTSIPVSPAELVEDSRKRKRRSVTPPVVAEEVEAKRKKLDNTADNDVSFIDAHDEVEAKADSKMPGTPSKDMRKLFTSEAQVAVEAPDQYDDEVDEATEPARHLATSSIYIANLKRPLQEAGLRRHLEAIARSKHENDDAPSPILMLYLDQVKTHALVLFNSVVAASRARAALHGHKYPVNELGRDPLFVDFVPDDKIAEWIDHEKNADGTGRTGGLRWHVVYTAAGEAVHEEIGGGVGRAQPNASRNASIASAPITALINQQPLELFPNRGNQDSGIHPSRRRIVDANTDSSIHLSRRSIVDSNTDAAVHPSRRSLVPDTAPAPSRAQAVPHPQPPPTNPKPSSASFNALATRFSQTTTKPSLYYKRADASLANKRLDILEDATSRDWRESDRRVGDTLFRYSFEFGDKFVSTGKSRGSERHAFIDRDLERAFRRRKEGGEGGRVMERRRRR